MGPTSIDSPTSHAVIRDRSGAELARLDLPNGPCHGGLLTDTDLPWHIFQVVCHERRLAIGCLRCDFTPIAIVVPEVYGEVYVEVVHTFWG